MRERKKNRWTYDELTHSFAYVWSEQYRFMEDLFLQWSVNVCICQWERVKYRCMWEYKGVCVCGESEREIKPLTLGTSIFPPILTSYSSFTPCRSFGSIHRFTLDKHQYNRNNNQTTYVWKTTFFWGFWVFNHVLGFVSKAVKKLRILSQQ